MERNRPMRSKAAFATNNRLPWLSFQVLINHRKIKMEKKKNNQYVESWNPSAARAA